MISIPRLMDGGASFTVTDTDGARLQVGDVTISAPDEETKEEEPLPSVPHTNGVTLNGHSPYAMLDTGAAPNLVRSGWLDMAMPEWRTKINRTGAATTQFKLADGGNSATPAGQVELPLDIGGIRVRRKFWVLHRLTTNMIVGSDLLQFLIADIDYGTGTMRSAKYPRMD